MGIASGLVLYAVIWFMVFFVVLPLRVTTQGDRGEVVPGTPASAPEVSHLKRKAWITSGIALVLWAIIAAIILTGAITVEDLDMFNRMNGDGRDG